MAMTMRVSTPGNNALTETDTDKYALYADADNILIKEKQRGTINIAHAANGTVAHNLNYVPYALAYGDISSKFYALSGGFLSSNIDATLRVSTANLVIRNVTGATRTFYYYIFYDQQV